MESNATVVTTYPNKAWITCDMAGNAHVFVQSEAPGSRAVKVCTVFYDYMYADNGSKRRIARAIAARYDDREIEERPQEASDA
ncbi:hypothetical protein D3C81_594690 [compost metagenome]